MQPDTPETNLEKFLKKFEWAAPSPKIEEAVAAGSSSATPAKHKGPRGQLIVFLSTVAALAMVSLLVLQSMESAKTPPPAGRETARAPKPGAAVTGVAGGGGGEAGAAGGVDTGKGGGPDGGFGGTLGNPAHTGGEGSGAPGGRAGSPNGGDGAAPAIGGGDGAAGTGSASGADVLSDEEMRDLLTALQSENGRVRGDARAQLKAYYWQLLVVLQDQQVAQGEALDWELLGRQAQMIGLELWLENNQEPRPGAAQNGLSALLLAESFDCRVGDALQAQLWIHNESEQTVAAETEPGARRNGRAVVKWHVVRMGAVGGKAPEEEDGGKPRPSGDAYEAAPGEWVNLLWNESGEVDDELQLPSFKAAGRYQVWFEYDMAGAASAVEGGAAPEGGSLKSNVIEIEVSQ